MKKNRDLRLARLGAALLLGAALSGPAAALEPFTVQDIRVEGLQRISAGTVFNYLPLKVGERLDARRSAEAIRALYKTGFFKDVRLEREGDVLVVSVFERPAISSVEFSGNKDIDTEQLKESLKQIGLAEGRVFNRSLLDRVETELERLYFSRGKYSVIVRTTVTPLERNRVGLSIDITEGKAARISKIAIAGNQVFDEEELLDEFKLRPTNWLSWIRDDDQYSKEKLTADLEALRSYYLDRGYINFNITSTQVSITPDKKDIHVTVNVAEGEQFAISGVKLAGELVVDEAELFPLVSVAAGDVFSRKATVETTEAITKRLGQAGYAFSNVNTIPEIDEENKRVALTFFIDPGKRVYVRRIDMVGNTKTRDEVLRREMRQMEGAVVDTGKVERSRDRLDKLGYFDEVLVETKPVAGATDQVDVQFSVEEKPSGNLMAGVGYSSGSGIVFSTSVTQDNFLGSGKRIGLGFNNSDVNTVYSFSYTNPYYTVDGISRGFSGWYRKTDAGEANIASYLVDSVGGSVNYGVPLTEYNGIFFTGSVENKEVTPGGAPGQRVLTDLAEFGNDITTFGINTSWSHDTRNSHLFPDRGSLISVGGEVATGDINYFKYTLRGQQFIPLSEEWTLMVNGDFAVGRGLGDTKRLPFFEYFLGGGVKSVRGFKDNTLGPRDSLTGDPTGGPVRVVGNAELLLPSLLGKDMKNVHFAAFIDAGNVYGVDEEVDFGDLRYSTGLTATWVSPFGPLTFVVAQPLNDKSSDETEVFQFTMGKTF